jgi:hypothetical protein
MFKQGKIDQAVELINAKYPQFLQQNAEVNFKLHRQCFVEHLRGCTDPRQALHYLKSEMPADLAAAHDSEWRQLSLMLLYKEQTRDSPVADEWQLSKRHELAKLILPRLERFLAIAEPPLSLYLRYLCLAHNMYYALRAEISPIQDDLDRLISPAEESKENGTLSSSSEQLRFDETDVFTLAQVKLNTFDSMM